MEQQKETYVFKTGCNINFQIDPREYGIKIDDSHRSDFDLSKYSNVAEIYREALAPTSVSVGFDPVTREKIAIKKIYKDQLVNEAQRKQAKQEFPLHCSLNHQNIVQAYQWSENDQEYILLMECLNKPDYFREKLDVNLNPVKNELKMKSYVSDILEGLTYVHKSGVVHGDMKLENLLVNSPEDEEESPIVKLCDFGLSHLLDPNTGKFYMDVKSGSHNYLAPEIKAGAFMDEKIDMWALGIILYKMAVAYKPTQIAGYKYGNGPIPFRKVDWKKRSPELQDLITQLLETDPAKRLSSGDALQHSWFNC